MRRLLAVLVLLIFGASCTPQLQAAVRVGDREPATWVFISVQDKSLQGVYRCKETEKGPICKKATLEE